MFLETEPPPQNMGGLGEVLHDAACGHHAEGGHDRIDWKNTRGLSVKLNSKSTRVLTIAESRVRDHKLWHAEKAGKSYIPKIFFLLSLNPWGIHNMRAICKIQYATENPVVFSILRLAHWHHEQHSLHFKRCCPHDGLENSIMSYLNHGTAIWAPS